VTTPAVAAQDATTMLWRELKHTLRYPMILIASILTPVVFLLLFVYILGEPIGHGLGDTARGAPYVDFLAPGILMMTVAAGSSTTAINVCTDMTGGIIDRFRTMAVTRGAVLSGHVSSNVLRTLLTTTFVTGVALLAGFRPRTSVADWFAVAGIVAAFAFALAWLSVAFGQLAAYAGVTIKAVRHYHQRGLLAEPPRDSSGYRCYSAQHAIDLVKIKTLAEAGVPLARINELLAADPDRFAAAGSPTSVTRPAIRNSVPSTSSTTRRSTGPRTTRACPRWPIAPRGGWPAGTAGPRANRGRCRTRPSPAWSPRRPACRRRPGTGSPNSPGKLAGTALSVVDDVVVAALRSWAARTRAGRARAGTGRLGG